MIIPFTPELHLTHRYVGWLNDGEVTKHMRHAAVPHTIHTCAEYHRRTIDAGNFMWAIIAGNNHIGNMTAVVDRLNARADLSILLGEHRREGHGTNAWISGMRNLFSMNLRKITCGCTVDNYGMISLAFKTEMMFDGIRHRHDLRDDKMVDVMHFAKWS